MDGIKVSKTQTIKQSSSRLVTKVREDSADRKHVKKVEDQIKKLKPPTTLLKQKSVDANRPQPTKSNFKLKSASGTSSEETKLKVKRSVAGVSKTRFFPNSKAMISNALKDGDREVAKISGSKVSGKVDTEMTKVKSSSRKESNSVSNKGISKISKSGSNSHTSNKRDANELKGKTSSTATRSKVNSTPVPKQKQSDSDCSSISSRYEMKSIAKVKSTSKDTSRQTYLDSNGDIMSERPGTATLRKGRLVNTNIVGPEVPEELVPKLVKEHSMLLKPFEFRSESKSKGKSVSRKETKGSKTKPNANEKSPNSSAGSRHSLRNANLEIPSTSKTKLKDKPSDTENEQIVTPMSSEGSHKSDSSNERDYEDDFNSYESDFEKYSSSSSSLHVPDTSGEDTSSISSSEGNSPLELTSATKRLSSAGTDEDKQMDSGHYDMPDYKHKQILDNIKESVEKENANLDVQKNNTASLSDEGFEDQRSLQFINFLDAQKKTIRRRSMEIRKKRGEEILSMIKLDTFSYTLFDLTPVPYEVFIKNYGRTNTVQSATQTGDDDIDEEIQTDNISVDMKWTQIPVCFSKLSPDEPSFWRTYKNEYLGVGSEYTVEPNIVKKPCNEHYLNKFLLSAGTLITKILEERDSENISSLKKNSRDLPFSDGYIAFNTTKSALRGSSVDYISFGCDNNKVFATVHTQKDKHMYVIAIWRAYSEEPKLVLESYSAISSCLVDLSSCFVYGGLYDGAILIWNTSPTSRDVPSHIPVYVTSVGFGHHTKIVAIQQLSDSPAGKTFLSANSSSKEICSLDEDGDIILWRVVVKQSTYSSKSPGADCKEVVLVKSTHVLLRSMYPDISDLVCTDFVLDTSNNNYAFISTNYGFIIHYFIKGGGNSVRTFQPGNDSTANCLEVCPFSSDFLLAGFTDGNINLYSKLIGKPLMVLSDKESSVNDNSIQLIQWSKTRPFVIYVKDSANNIHIWDLNESDIFPIYSVPFQKNITCLKLCPSVEGSENSNAFLVLATDDGSLYMHHLNTDHGQQPKSTYEEHVKTFLNYVSRL